MKLTGKGIPHVGFQIVVCFLNILSGNKGTVSVKPNRAGCPDDVLGNRGSELTC